MIDQPHQRFPQRLQPPQICLIKGALFQRYRIDYRRRGQDSLSSVEYEANDSETWEHHIDELGLPTDSELFVAFLYFLPGFSQYFSSSASATIDEEGTH